MPNLNDHADLSREARWLNFGLRNPLLPYFVCARGKGSDETARILMNEGFSRLWSVSENVHKS